MKVELTRRDRQRLQGTHGDLIRVIENIAQDSPFEFFIIQGVRTHDEQIAAVQAGKSETMNSRHIHGFAVDIAVKVEGALTWDNKYYIEFSKKFLAVAKALKIPVVWGGSWTTIKDYDHFELDRKFYPDPYTLT